jgi:hypothetical protein
VSISATDANAAETGGDTGQFTVSRTGSTSGSLTVYYEITGEAENGVDYSTIPASATIPNGLSSTTIDVTPMDDSLAEGDEDVSLEVKAHYTYALGTAEATAVIAQQAADAAPSIQILDGASDRTDHLDVGDWYDAFETVNNVERVKATFVDLDTDRFYVRVRHPAANTNPATVQTIEVTLSTDSPGTAHDDGPVVVTISETGVNTGSSGECVG